MTEEPRIGTFIQVGAALHRSAHMPAEPLVAENDYRWWQKKIAGENPLTYETPECGYFKVRDRRGLNKNLAPIKRPWVACAIWRDGSDLKAELAGVLCDVDRIWPYCAKYPITYEAYQFWHTHERWPEANEGAAA